MLAVEGLSKRFGGFLAVNQVSFEVRAGEILGLIGPNGSGKSTTFNLIAGTLRPSFGLDPPRRQGDRGTAGACDLPSGSRAHVPDSAAVP